MDSAFQSLKRSLEKVKLKNEALKTVLSSREDEIVALQTTLSTARAEVFSERDAFCNSVYKRVHEFMNTVEGKESPAIEELTSEIAKLNEEIWKIDKTGNEKKEAIFALEYEIRTRPKEDAVQMELKQKIEATTLEIEKLERIQKILGIEENNRKVPNPTKGIFTDDVPRTIGKNCFVFQKKRK